ncbi:hypothetical protein MJL33_31005, partial [Salmonella enterica subsp. enterica serovar Kentucky]|nr:hypothetical protein [Salmonella enterica subsp. enterica serovar Kentucky]
MTREYVNLRNSNVPPAERRDSKAGISFLAVYDGSCFDPVQAVINNSLPNYNEEVLHLTT